jgi:hypothetical protein
MYVIPSQYGAVLDFMEWYKLDGHSRLALGAHCMGKSFDTGQFENGSVE